MGRIVLSKLLLHFALESFELLPARTLDVGTVPAAVFRHKDSFFNSFFSLAQMSDTYQRTLVSFT